MFSLLAAATAKVTPLEKLQSVSGQFWLKVILGILIFAFVVYAFKKVAGMNKIILTIVLAVIFGIVGFNWIYNRNEPEALTPIVNILAQWFPSKGAYETKQQQDPGKGGPQKTPAAPANPSTPAPRK